jgi:BRCT domain type II-containing protein
MPRERFGCLGDDDMMWVSKYGARCTRVPSRTTKENNVGCMAGKKREEKKKKSSTARAWEGWMSLKGSRGFTFNS